jgi:SAM-dependent methyltransferase
MLRGLTWKEGQVLVGDQVFEIDEGRDKAREPAPTHLRLFKNKRTLDQYQHFWARRPDFRHRHVLELGIFQGGSVAFWCELWKPEKFVAIDIQDSQDTAPFKQWRASRGFDEIVKTYWKTNQADAARLRAIVKEDFDGHLDLVIDDASHLYEPTKKSFEVLFPLLRPGGVYIIEDWSWGCWPKLPLDFGLPHGTELPRLVGELAEATGSIARSLEGKGPLATIKPLIATMEVYPDFVVLERGPGDSPAEFELASYITRRPTKPAGAPSSPVR